MIVIDVNGVNPTSRKKAETELQELFGLFKNLKVIVTQDFDNVVQKYLLKRGVTEPYESTRAGGEVVASKTMHYPLNTHLGTCLVINSNCEIFFNWDARLARIDQLFYLLHEREHILLSQDHYQLMGHKNFFSNPLTKMEWMRELAKDISDEYLAERKAITIMQDAHQGGLDSFFLTRTGGIIEILLSYLKSFQLFLTEKTNLFRKRRISTDDFWGFIYLRTRDTLNSLALVTAQSHAISSISLEFKPIKLGVHYAQLFEETWSKIERELALMYNNKMNRKKTIQYIASEFENLFLRFDIEMFDTSQGLNVCLTKLQ